MLPAATPAPLLVGEVPWAGGRGAPRRRAWQVEGEAVLNFESAQRMDPKNEKLKVVGSM